MAAGEATATAEHIPAVTSSIENVLSLQPDRLITLEKDECVTTFLTPYAVKQRN